MYIQVVIASVVLSVFLSFEAIVIKYLNVKNYHVPFEQLVILTDVFKFLVSLGLYFCTVKRSERDPEYFDASDTFSDTFSEESIASDTQSKIQSRWEWGNMYYFLLPAVVYTISNNVTYIALNELSPAMYNLLMNLKIPFTGILAYVFLRYRLTVRFVVSYTLLVASTVLASLKISDGVSFNASVLGVLYMLVYASCSSSGAVLMEQITQITFRYESIYIQNVKFAIMNIMCNLVVMLVRFEVPFVNLNWVHLVVICVSGVYGLITAVVIKYGGSILKTYSVTVSVFISALLTYIIWGTVYSWNFYVGTSLCMYSVYLYSQEYNKIKSQHTINEIVLGGEESEYLEEL